MKAKSVVKKSSVRAAKAVRSIFTVRDMNRQPQAVLNAARKLGEVQVQSRTGEKFVLKPVAEPKAVTSDLEYRRAFHARIKDLQERMRTAGQGFTSEGWDTFSKMLAGE